MRTRPSWEEYQRHLADERTAACSSAWADELARSQFCEHDRNRPQTCPSCGTVAEDGVPRPTLTVFTSDDGWVLISGDGMRRTVSAVSDERTDMLILDLFERVFGTPPTRPGRRRNLTAKATPLVSGDVVARHQGSGVGRGVFLGPRSVGLRTMSDAGVRVNRGSQVFGIPPSGKPRNPENL